MLAPFSLTYEPSPGAVPFKSARKRRGAIMSQGVAVDICRVTVLAPRRVDLALPGTVPFAQLPQGIAHFAGLDAAAMAGAPEGSSRQRLGEPAFEPRRRRLRRASPTATAVPAPLDDGAAARRVRRHCRRDRPVHDGPGRWHGRDGRRGTLGAGRPLLASGLVVMFAPSLAIARPHRPAGCLAVLLLAAGARRPRPRGDAVPERSSATRPSCSARRRGPRATGGRCRSPTLSALRAGRLRPGDDRRADRRYSDRPWHCGFFGVAIAAAFGIAGAALAYLWPG